MSKPLYRQVADALRAEIADGVFGPGADLPSERELRERFDASRNTVRQGLQLLVSEGLVASSQGRAYQVRSQEVFILNASKFENLQFSRPENGDSYNNEVLDAGRQPHQDLRVEMVRAPQDIAERLRVTPGEQAVLRFCLRLVDETPWSTQATHYPKWLVDAHPRLAEPDDIEEGSTRYLADRGVEQIGYRDELMTRMPTPEEARMLQIGPGIPVLIWVRTGFSSDRPVRCTRTTFRGDLNHITYDLGDLRAHSSESDLH
jgi:GntR family transcriptional regulator